VNNCNYEKKRGSVTNMTTTNESQRELKKFFQSANIDFSNPDKYASITIRLASCDDIDAQDSVRIFLHRLNRKILGSQHRNGKRDLIAFAVREGSYKSDNLHYHLMVEIPEQARAKFNDSVLSAWLAARRSPKARLRNEQPHVQPVYDDQWLSYMLKPQSKSNYLDAIDWINTRLPK